MGCIPKSTAQSFRLAHKVGSAALKWGGGTVVDVFAAKGWWVGNTANLKGDSLPSVSTAYSVFSPQSTVTLKNISFAACCQR